MSEQSPDRPAVTIIIPTTCESARRESLARAIDSVLSQEGVDVRLLLVVNGSRYDSSLLDRMRGDHRFTTVHLLESSLPAARAHGRNAVETEYFGFLDDDDEFLPWALRLRCTAMKQNPGADFVVTNGYHWGEQTPYYKHVGQIEIDPMMALLEQNWLPSAGGLFRNETCQKYFFEEMPAYLEWTALAFRLLLAGKHVLYVDDCTFRINNSPASLSKSTSYHFAIPQVLLDLLQLKMQRRIRKKLKQKLSAARHDLSVASLERGLHLQAWAYHLQSLAGIYGLRYISYTKHLLF